MKQYRTAIVIVACLSLSIFFFRTKGGLSEVPAITKANFSGTSAPTTKNLYPGRSEPSRSNVCQTVVPIASPQKIYKPADETQRQALLEQAYADPAKLLAVAESNPEAYIALFRLTSACFPDALRPGLVKKRYIDGCPNVLMRIKGHPLNLLERAAELGSIEAKLAFSMNARLYKKFYHTGDSENGLIDSKKLLAKAEQFGIEAARAGHPDAYRHMSLSYENGEFGERDLERAFAFSLPLENIGDRDDKQRILELSLKLKQEEKNRAKTMAFGCSENQDGSSLRSPF